MARRRESNARGLMGSSSRVKRSGAREHRAGEQGAAYLTTVQRGRDEQSVPQKPLARGDFPPLRVPVRHETVRALQVLLGDARVHVAKQPEQVEVIEVEADELGLPDAIARRGAVVLAHDFPGRDFPGRVVYDHLFANLPDQHSSVGYARVSSMRTALRRESYSHSLNLGLLMSGQARSINRTVCNFEANASQ